MAKQPFPRAAANNAAANQIPTGESTANAVAAPADQSANQPAAQSAVETIGGEVVSIPFSALFQPPAEAKPAATTIPTSPAIGQPATVPANPPTTVPTAASDPLLLGNEKPTGLLFTSGEGANIERIHQYARENPTAEVTMTLAGNTYKVPAAVASKLAADDASTRTLQSNHDRLSTQYKNTLDRIAAGEQVQGTHGTRAGAQDIGLPDGRAQQGTSGTLQFVPDPAASAALDVLDRQFGGTGELKQAVSAIVQSAVAHVRREMVMPLATILADHQGKLGMVEPLGHDRADLDEITTIVHSHQETDPASPIASFTPSDILTNMRVWQNGMIGKPGGPPNKDEAYNHSGYKSAAFNWAINQLLMSKNGNFTITAPAVGGTAQGTGSTPVQSNARAQGQVTNITTLEQTIAQLQQEVARLSGRGTTIIPTAGDGTTGNREAPPRPVFNLTPDPNTRLMQLLHSR